MAQLIAAKVAARMIRFDISKNLFRVDFLRPSARVCRYTGWRAPTRSQSKKAACDPAGDLSLEC
jgi:hypothetical protein